MGIISSSYSADLNYGCYSSISEYSPSTGCSFHVPKSDIGNSIIKSTINGTTVRSYLRTLGATTPFEGPFTTTFDEDEKPTMVGMAGQAIMTMIHKKSDFDSAYSKPCGALLLEERVMIYSNCI